MEQVTGQFRFLILVVPCLIEAPCLPTVLNMLEDIRHWYPIIKDYIRDVSVDLVLKVLPLHHLTLCMLRDELQR